MSKSDFYFWFNSNDQMMYYKCHKVLFWRRGAYIESTGCIKKKKTTMNPKDGDNKCFQYAATVALNYEEIK